MQVVTCRKSCGCWTPYQGVCAKNRLCGCHQEES
nr:MAG TPA: hypothetical protein [Caudoviricetes sp.]